MTENVSMTLVKEEMMWAWRGRGFLWVLPLVITAVLVSYRVFMMWQDWKDFRHSRVDYLEKMLVIW